MKKRLLFILCLTLTVSAFAQTKTITNADLEKYRQKRLAAEREYAENYERLGFPSPAELQKQNEQSRREFSELSQRLEREQLEREQLARQQNFYFVQNVTVNNRRSNYPYFYNYYPFGFYYFRIPPRQTRNQNNQIQPIRPPKPIRSPFSDRTFRRNQ